MKVPTMIKQFSDGSRLEFDKGTFDDWCVYFTAPGQRKMALRDISYFRRLQKLSVKYGGLKIYRDFVAIYNRTTSALDESVLKLIEELAAAYHPENLMLEKLFTILYAGMVAEENKAKAILKKRVKRLGVHQVLIENVDPKVAANFSRGKSWKELDLECLARQF